MLYVHILFKPTFQHAAEILAPTQYRKAAPTPPPPSAPRVYTCLIKGRVIAPKFIGREKKRNNEICLSYDEAWRHPCPVSLT